MELKNLEDLITVFKAAILTKQNLGIIIEMPDFESPEIIVNPTENLSKKLEYYQNTYDENLEHKHAKGIKIIGYTFC